MPKDVSDAFEKLTIGELATIHEVAPDHPYSAWKREHGTKENAAHQHCQAERERIAAELGEPEADEAQSAQFDRAHELAGQLLEIRSASLTGVMVKLRLRDWLDYSEGSEASEAILNSVDDDLRAWAGAPPREVDEAEGDTDV